MKFDTLSASAITLWLECPKAWAARYTTDPVMRAPTMSGEAALLGKVCHDVLETWVKGELHIEKMSPNDAQSTMTLIYDDAYSKAFGSNRERYEDGLNMVLGWMDRQDFTNREVLETEVERSFEIKTRNGTPIKVVWITDRVDRVNEPHPLGMASYIEVLDYKTTVRSAVGTRLAERPQPRLYALGAQKMYPDEPAIVFTLDELRHDTVSVEVTKEESRESWKWLRDLATEIEDTAEEDLEERVGFGCRYCVRKLTCKTIRVHHNAGGSLGRTDFDDMAVDHVKLGHQIKALEASRDEIGQALADYSEENGYDHWETLDESVGVSVTSKAKGKLDKEKFLGIVGNDVHEFILTYGNPSVATVRRAIKMGWTPTLEEWDPADLPGCIDVNQSAVSVTTFEKN